MRLAKTRILSENQTLVRETVTYYDDLDREVITAVYSHPGVPAALDPSGPAGAFYGANPANTIAAILANTKLPLALDQVIYNARGNIEERRRYSPAANQTSKYLSTRSYYDHADRRVLEERPGGGSMRTWYDAEGNVSRSSLYAGAREVRRTVDERDQFKNVIVTTTFERLHDASATPDELDATNSVATYTFTWHDQAGKVIASADLGTADAGNQFKNAASAPVRPTAPPTWDTAASAYTGSLGATALITLTEYDAQGRPVAVRSPKGLLTRSFYSNLGHVILQVENADGAPSLVRRTAYKFDKGRLIAVAAVLPGHVVQPDGQIDWTPAATLQITGIEYGADVVAYSTSTPGAVLYTDPAKVARVFFPSIPGSTGAPDFTFKYYPDGRLARRTDRRGLEFTYFYDGRGNRTAAIVSNRQEYDPFQSALVDVSEEVQLAYDAIDRLIGVSAAAQSSLFFESKSDVAFSYDALGNLIADHQYHGDKLVVGSASVTYGWDFSPAASNNRVRLSSMTYPHWSSAPATSLAFGYGAAGSESDKLDRLSSISSGSNQLASYRYTGAGRRVGTAMDQAAMDQTAGSGGTYGGLDRFGRTTAITWKRAGTTQQSYVYGYDAAGNALFERWDHMFGGVLNQNKLSQKFAYDALNRMISAERGQLDATNTAIAHSAAAPTARLVEWGLDNLDNLTGNATLPSGLKTSWFNVSINQQVTTGAMTHAVDAQNQVTGITATGNYATGVGTISGAVIYDRAGNMVADAEYFYQYDAWNRLVQVSDRGTATFNADGVIASGAPGSWRIHYTYDGLGRQIRKQQPWTEGNGDKFVRSVHYFYDGVRRIQEVVVDPLSSAAPVELKDDKCEPPPAEEDSLTLTLDREYVYGPGDRLGVDEFVCQIDSLGNFVYMLQNAAGDVTALVRDGEVICQYTFDPNGVLINADHIEAQVVNRVGHKGLFFDRIDGHPMGRQLLANARGLYQNRNRVYHPMLGRFMQKDPNESGLPVIANGAMMASNPAMASLLPFDAQGMYGDGMNLYGYLGGNPYARRDPLGLSWDPFSMTDDYLAEAAGAQAAFLERVIRGFDTASHIAWQLAQLHPAIGLAASAYKLASGEGDLWDVLAVAGPAGKLIGKAMGAAKKAAGYYISKFGTCKICVAEGTLVQTPLGPVPVECIQPGDLVLSLAEDDPLGLPRFMPVTAVYHNEGSELLAVTFADGGTLRLTAAHEVYTTDKGWGLAEDLRPGQRMLGESTSVREIAKVDRFYGAVPTYNLTVEGSHTFYADGVWVHNCAKARAQWKRWQLTDAASDAVKVHGRFGKIYKRGETWWSKDLAGHGGSAFKVFEETPSGLRWIRDADEFGNHIVGKHKGPIGAFIPWSELR
ncbi:MAG TPA: polymorphic toxin-type HINT domain-containing protein [Phycisphaerales bacterium]|nr:polymorphic toxin-type HINT domain-containing protein [Phycisphaerales bacterium]